MSNPNNQELRTFRIITSMRVITKYEVKARNMEEAIIKATSDYIEEGVKFISENDEPEEAIYNSCFEIIDH